jgi:hypothetical protein
MNHKETSKKLYEAVVVEKMKVGILLADPTEIKHTMAYTKETGTLSS